MLKKLFSKLEHSILTSYALIAIAVLAFYFLPLFLDVLLTIGFVVFFVYNRGKHK